MKKCSIIDIFHPRTYMP